jgi:hypothetical protein
MSLGGFLCSVEAGRSKVARRVTMEVRKVVLGPVLSPLGSLAIMALVDWIWRVTSWEFWCWAVRTEFHLMVFSFHRGARYLSSLLEYCRSLQCCLTSLS